MSLIRKLSAALFCFSLFLGASNFSTPANAQSGLPQQVLDQISNAAASGDANLLASVVKAFIEANPGIANGSAAAVAAILASPSSATQIAQAVQASTSETNAAAIIASAADTLTLNGNDQAAAQLLGAITPAAGPGAGGQGTAPFASPTDDQVNQNQLGGGAISVN